MNFIDALKELERLKKSVALCTVVSVKGSTPRKVGTKMFVWANGDDFGAIIGTIGGGAIEHHIRKLALEVLKSHKALLTNVSLRNDFAMCCGGEMTVFIDPIIMAPKLLLFGAGHIAQALGPLANSLGFSVYIIDERSELINRECFINCERIERTFDPFFFNTLHFGSETFVVVATHDHALDQKIIEHTLPHEFKYLALVGSKRKAFMTKKRLMAKGFSEIDQEKIICPAGLHINAISPEEIALSIAAQMTEVRNAPGTLSSDHCSSGSKHAHGLSQSLA